MKYELTLSPDGQLTLTLDGELMWDSQHDEDFCEEFGDLITSRDIDDAAAWLVQEGYIPPRVPVDFLDESVAPGEESGWFKTLNDDGPGDDEDDEDDEEVAEEAEDEA